MPKPMLRSTPLAAQLTRSSLAFAATPQQTATPESAAARGQVQRQADLRTGIYDVLISEQRTRLALLIQRRQQEMQQGHTTAPAASNRTGCRKAEHDP